MSDDERPLWRKYIGSWRTRTAVTLCLALALLALAVVHHSWSSRERDAYTYLVRTNYWIASQLELELLEFLSTVDRFVLADGEASHDEVLLQFDLLWSRIPVFLKGPEAAAAREVDGAISTVTGLLSTLRRLEPIVSQLTPRDDAGRDLITDSLVSYKDLLHGITIDVAVGQRRQQLVDRIRALEDRRLLLEIAILGAALVLILFFLFELHRSRQQAEKERQLREAAMVASQAKSRFLAAMGHELRTPLNAIIGFSEIMKMEKLGALGSPGYARYAESILTSGHHLLAVVNDVLDLAHVESGTLRLNENLFDPCTVVESCVKKLKPMAEGKEVKVTCLLDRPAPTLRGDPRLFQQVCLNIVGNAVKFSSVGGHVIIICSRHEDELELVVEDNGPGIVPEALDQVTAPFHQLDADLNRRNEGCGVGLTLAKAFVELHGGRLYIESRVGFGTRVSTRFPKQRVLDQDSAAA